MVFSDVCQDFEATVEECDGERDYVHWLITCPPNVSISVVVFAEFTLSFVRNLSYP